MVTALGTYLGTELGTDLGTFQDGAPRFDATQLYALSASGSNFYQTEAGGGEAGDAGGFGILMLARLEALTGIQGLLFGRSNGSSDGYQAYLLSTNTLNFRCYVPGLTQHNGRVFVPSDVGKIFALYFQDTGSTLTSGAGGESQRTPTAVSGFVPSSTVMMTCRHAGFSPLGWLSFRGTPSDAQLQAAMTAARTGGDLPAAIVGATVTHRQSLREELAKLARPIVDGELAPASLPDTVTAATVDAMARQGSPTVKVIDPSIDGRKTYGALGFSTTSLLQTAGGIRGGASFVAAWTGVINAQDGTNRTMQSTRIGADGWRMTQNNANTALWVYDGAAALNITGGPVLPTGVPVAVVGMWSAGVGRTFVCTPSGVVETVGTAGTAGFTPSAEPFRIGDSGAAGDEGINQSWFGSTGMDGATVTLAQVTAWWASVQQTGRMQPLPGAQHTWDAMADIVANGGPDNGVPMQVLDRIGTDHLTTVGVAVQTGPNGIRGVGPYSSADSFASLVTGGIRGTATGHHVVVDFVPSNLAGIVGLHAPVSCTNSAATNGWSIQISSSGTRISIGAAGTAGVTHAASGVAVGQRARVLLQFDGTDAVCWVNGVASAVITPGAYVAPTGGMVIGYFGSPTVQTFTSGWVELVQGGDNTLLSPAEITALFADLTVPPPIVVGKTLKRWRLEQDIAAAGGLPAVSVERIAGGDSLVRIGSPLQVAQRAERVWSYETTPILYGSGGHTANDFYESATGGAGNTLAFGGTMVWTPRATAVSAIRVLLSTVIISPARGWDIRTTGTNALVSMYFVNGANTGIASGSAALAGKFDKINVFSFQWDGVAGRLRVYLNRVETGTGTTIAGFAPSPGGISLGRERYGTTAPGTDNDAFGFTLWDGIASIAQIQAQHDAIMANDGRIQPCPGVTGTMMIDPTLDAIANGGTLGATLTDRAGTNHFTRTGAPSTVPQYARAFGF